MYDTIKNNTCTDVHIYKFKTNNIKNKTNHRQTQRQHHGTLKQLKPQNHGLVPIIAHSHPQCHTQINTQIAISNPNDLR